MDNRRDLMSDIYEATSRPVARLSKAPQPLPPEPPRRSRLKITLLFIGFPLLATILFYGTRGLVVKAIARQSAEVIKQRIEQAKQALIAFDVTGAQSAFIDIKRIVADIRAEANRYGLLGLANVASVVSPRLSAAPEALTLLDQLSDKVLEIIRTSEFLKNKAFDLVVGGQGKLLITQLTALRDQVSDLGGIIEEMKAKADTLDYPVGDDALAFRADLYKSEQLLDAAIEWLSGVSHIAITFVNPSEIRPGGGFPGSYAAVSIAKGNLGTIEVRDIYDPDGQLDLKVVPPKQLRAITTTWGARDANWFFDFPTSARKTLFFLNSSKLYSEQDLTFGALLAINVNVVSDLLSVTGPIELPEYKLTLTSENFLDEVQREVRSGMDRTVGEPKRILKVLTPILFERLGAFSDFQKHELITHLQKRFAAKDMLAYIADPLLQAYLEQLGVAGEVQQSQESTLNDYLAVVNANIGGGKSDAVMTQSISLKSRIDLEGRINNTVTIKRAHGATATSASWYNTTNKNFLQIFTPRGSRGVATRGHDTQPTLSNASFKGYDTDSDLSAIEGSDQNLAGLGIGQTLAFNKTVFSAWLNTAPGTTRTLELQYENSQKLSPRTFTDYTFMFEKQPGVETEFSFVVDAPPDYKWKESNSTTYSYQTEAAPGKLEIHLTLIPI